MADTIVIVTSADRRYAMPLTVMLWSMLAHCRKDSWLEVHVLDGGLSGRQKRKVLRSLGSGRYTLTWHDMTMPSDKLRGLPVFGHVSLATYYRFLIPQIVAAPKAIYIDADTVVLGDVTELWSEPIGDQHLLGVQVGTVSSGMLIAGAEQYGVSPHHPRLSAGVLVMNLAKWRAQDPFLELKDYLLKFYDRLQFWDQDALNIVLAHKWRAVPGAWNYIVDCGLPVAGSNAETMARLHREAKILHYASSMKPWHYYAAHPGGALFYEYLDRTAWANWRPTPPVRALLNLHFWGDKMRRVPGVGRLWTMIIAQLRRKGN